MRQISKLEDFYEAIEQDKTTLIYFYAPWCRDCFGVSKYIDKLDSDYNEIEIIKINRDHLLELASHLSIWGIPSFLLFKSGTELGRFVDKNHKTYEQVKTFIDNTL